MNNRVSDSIYDVVNIFIRENSENESVMNIVLEVLNDLSAQYIYKKETDWKINSLFEMYEKLAWKYEGNDESVINMYMKDSIADRLFNNLKNAISIVSDELDHQTVTATILSSFMFYAETLHKEIDYFKDYVSPDKEVNEHLKNNDMLSFVKREVQLRFNIIKDLDQVGLN